MREIKSIRGLKNAPAAYALFGGHGTNEYVAYVGVADKLRQRVEQHLIKHDSSVTTGRSANPESNAGPRETRHYCHLQHA